MRTFFMLLAFTPGAFAMSDQVVADEKKEKEFVEQKRDRTKKESYDEVVTVKKWDHSAPTSSIFASRSATSPANTASGSAPPANIACAATAPGFDLVNMRWATVLAACQVASGLRAVEYARYATDADGIRELTLPPIAPPMATPAAAVP